MHWHYRTSRHTTHSHARQYRSESNIQEPRDTSRTPSSAPSPETTANLRSTSTDSAELPASHKQSPALTRFLPTSLLEIQHLRAPGTGASASHPAPLSTWPQALCGIPQIPSLLAIQTPLRNPWSSLLLRFRMPTSCHHFFLLANHSRRASAQAPGVRILKHLLSRAFQKPRRTFKNFHEPRSASCDFASSPSSLFSSEPSESPDHLDFAPADPSTAMAPSLCIPLHNQAVSSFTHCQANSSPSHAACTGQLRTAENPDDHSACTACHPRP